MKSFLASKIQHVANTDETFDPRFPVEITKAGELSGSLYFEGNRTPRSLFGIAKPRSARRRARKPARFVVQCTVCGKRFRRTKYSARLKPHKDRYGNRCIGRIGHMV